MQENLRQDLEKLLKEDSTAFWERFKKAITNEEIDKEEANNFIKEKNEELNQIANKLFKDLQKCSNTYNKREINRIIDAAEAFYEGKNYELNYKVYYILGRAYYLEKNYSKAACSFIRISSLGSAEEDYHKESIEYIKKCYLHTIEKILYPEKLIKPQASAQVQFQEDGKRISYLASGSSSDADDESDKIHHLLSSQWTKENTLYDTFDLRKESQKEYKVQREILKRSFVKGDKEFEGLFKAHSGQYTAKKRARMRRHLAEITFFNPLRSKKKNEVFELCKEIIEARFSITADDTSREIHLAGRSTRQLLMAERLFQEAAIELFGHKKLIKGYYMDLGIPSNSKEIYKVGTSSFPLEHRQDPSRNKLGDVFFPKLGNYDVIYERIKYIARNDPEAPRSNSRERPRKRKLMNYILQFSKKFPSTSLEEELKKINEEIDNDDLEIFLNFCALITGREQSQWLSSKDSEYHAGLSVAQARCLILLREGYLSFSDVFPRNSDYGVFSQTELLTNFSNVKGAADRIDAKYLEYLKKKDASLFAKNSRSQIVLSRKEARRVLQEVYGGESDTDASKDYESDLAYGSS